MYHSSENMSETFTYPVEQQVKLLQADVRNRGNFIEKLSKQLLRQGHIIHSFWDQNFKLEQFTTEKETLNDSPTLHLIHFTADRHLDPIGNSPAGTPRRIDIDPSWILCRYVED